MASIKTISGGKHAGPSARDLTAYQWRAAKFTGRASAGDTATLESEQTIDVAGAGDRVEGIIEYPGSAAGQPTTLITLGRIKIKLGYAGVAGDKIKSGPNGVALKALAGEAAFGSLIEGGPVGAVAPFEFDRTTA
jgi:hypothetical protein